MSSLPPPAWLPPLQTLTGELQQDLATLHGIFSADFTHSRPGFLGMPVEWRQTLVSGTIYEDAFWHIVTRDSPQAGVRVFDRLRAERLPWCAAVLRNATDQAVKVWDFRKTRRIVRTYAWLEHHDYVVVLEKRMIKTRPSAFLITAYHVDGTRSRNQLQRTFDERIR